MEQLKYIAFAMLVLAFACTPTNGPADGGEEQLRDDAGNVLVRVDQLTVHVAGYQGQGLTLLIDGEQQLEVPADGIWKIKLTKATIDAQMTVMVQPASPDQHCDISKLDPAVFTVSCHEQRWTVSGTVKGLAGKGLQLGLSDDSGDETGSELHAVYSVPADGAFSFVKPLPDHANYEVKVLAQPTKPRQVCTVVNGSGIAENVPVDNVQVNCATEMYHFEVVITGLRGSGLTVSTVDGVFPAVAGVYTAASVPDGLRYDVAIGSQPTNPDQLCYIADGVGIVDGKNPVINIICDALGTLIVSEVGSCPQANSSCWFEIKNTGTVAEQLAFYRVRTSARSGAGVLPARVFTLPTAQVGAGGTVVIQGKTANALPDGQGVFHIASDDAVPWWNADGFVELLNPAGATVSFVRFGANATQPTTGGVWSGGAAPALAVGTNAYGSSIAHTPTEPRLNGPEDWRSTSFATYGGPNDSFNDNDVDRDGIPDGAETAGGSFAGIDVYSMGARVGARDVFIEVDRVATTDVAAIPRKEALQKVVDAFMRRNIVLHFDVGNLYASSFDPANFNLGGGGEVAFAAAVTLEASDPTIVSLYAYKAANMEARRRMLFYYQLFALSQQNTGVGPSGAGELPGNDTLITLGGLGLSAGTAAQRNNLINYQAAGVMHELGHNFGLRHGGGDQLSRKPNYLSVMNYLYSPVGLPTIGNNEGDRFGLFKRCKVSSPSQLTNPPNGDVNKFIIDYSSGTSATMSESAILESAGLGRMGSGAVDFNCNSQTDSQYALDLNGDGTYDTFSDNDDWNKLDFVFRRSADGAENGPSLLAADQIEHTDILTADTVHKTDDPCP